MYLLDTNVVSELRRATAGKADPRVVAWTASVPIVSLFVSVVTVLELEWDVSAQTVQPPEFRSFKV